MSYEMLDHARKYLTRGFSIIPLKPKGKRPALDSWAEFQNRRPTENEVLKWFGNGAENNVGIITGRISGIAVIDLDSEEALAFAKENNFPTTPRVRTGKGYHCYYGYPENGVRNFQGRDDLPGVDLRGEGGYVVAPPSLHPSGTRYEWLEGQGLDDIPLAELPEGVLVAEPGQKTPLKDLYRGVPVGERNVSLTRLAGSWVRNGLSFDECLENAHIWNSRNKVPLPESEIEATVRSIFGRDRAKQTPELIVDPFESVYSGWAGHLSLAWSSVTECPRSFYFMSALTMLGTLLSGRVTLASQISPQPRLYTVILGESADDRKSTAIKETVEFFREVIPDFPVCYGVGSAEGLAEQFKEQNRLLPGEFKEQNQLLLCCDEFKTFVSKAKIETSILLQTVNTLFEDNRFESATKRHTIELRDVHLSLLAASTVDTYSNVFDKQFLDIGFTNRLFVVKDHGQKRWAIPPKIDLKEKQDLQKRLTDILQIAQGYGTRELEIMPDAHQLFQEWYLNLPRTQVAKRLDTYGLRLMLLLAVNDGKTEVDLETVKRVIALLDYEYRIRIEVDPIDADNEIAKMEEKIRRVLKANGKTGIRDLKRKTNYNRSGIYIFNTALKNLEQEREIRKDENHYELMEVSSSLSSLHFEE